MRLMNTYLGVAVFCFICASGGNIGCYRSEQHRTEKHVRTDWQLFKSVETGMDHAQVMKLLGPPEFEYTNRYSNVIMQYGEAPDQIYLEAPMSAFTTHITLSNNTVIAKKYFGKKPDWELFKQVKSGMNLHEVDSMLGPAIAEACGQSYYKAYYGNPTGDMPNEAKTHCTIVVTYSTNDVFDDARVYGSEPDTRVLLTNDFWGWSRKEVEQVVGQPTYESRGQSLYHGYYGGTPLKDRLGAPRPTTIEITFSMDSKVQSKKFFGKRE